MTTPHDYRLADGTGTDAFTRPAWFTDVDDLRQLADRLKRLIEERRWAEVEALLTLDRIWAFDRPLPLAESLAAAAAVLADAVDIHLWFEKILKAEAKDGAGHVTLNCCLMWGERGNLRDHEFELDLHLGFGREAGGGWAFRYVGVTPGTPERVPFPVERGAAKATDPAAPASQAPPAWTLAGGSPGLAPPPGQVLAYLPVFVPAEAVAAAVPPPPTVTEPEPLPAPGDGAEPAASPPAAVR